MSGEIAGISNTFRDIASALRCMYSANSADVVFVMISYEATLSPSHTHSKTSRDHPNGRMYPGWKLSLPTA
jgi:hypothetical protein